MAFHLRRHQLINISCHCGNVQLTFERLPKVVRDCDCPMCNRLGALWGDYSCKDVTIETQIATATYCWGDGTYEMHHCTQCGCSTHYTESGQDSNQEIGINFRLLDRKELEKIPISR